MAWGPLLIYRGLAFGCSQTGICTECSPAPRCDVGRFGLVNRCPHHPWWPQSLHPGLRPNRAESVDWVEQMDPLDGVSRSKVGVAYGGRTRNLRIHSPLLCRLS